jgi:hypothetical protein
VDGGCAMQKHEPLGDARPGRRPSIKRLVFRPPARNLSADSPKGSGQAWRDRDWSSIKERLRLTVKRAPEVVINVKGSRRSQDSDHAAIEGVLRYMMYISRNGQLPTFDEHGERGEGREEVRDKHASWNLDMQRMKGMKNEPLHPSFNIIFSMPAKTDPEKILEAVQAVAQARFQGRQYLMALHTHETDPAKDACEHPHVHLILRAEDEDGNRIHIRKTDLRAWREQFAEELRARGIEANATSRAERGRSRKAVSSAEWHIQKRYQDAKAPRGSHDASQAKVARFYAAAEELREGRTEPKPWEIAMAARRRDVLRELADNAVRLRREGDSELADQVERFAKDMAPLDSERRQIQRALVEQVKKRLREHGVDNAEDLSR